MSLFLKKIMKCVLMGGKMCKKFVYDEKIANVLVDGDEISLDEVVALLNKFYEDKENFKKEAQCQQGQKQRLSNYLRQYLDEDEIREIANDDEWLIDPEESDSNYFCVNHYENLGWVVWNNNEDKSFCTFDKKYQACKVCRELNALYDQIIQLEKDREEMFFRERDTKNEWRDLKYKNQKLQEIVLKTKRHPKWTASL